MSISRVLAAAGDETRDDARERSLEGARRAEEKRRRAAEKAEQKRQASAQARAGDGIARAHPRRAAQLTRTPTAIRFCILLTHSSPDCLISGRGRWRPQRAGLRRRRLPRRLQRAPGQRRRLPPPPGRRPCSSSGQTRCARAALPPHQPAAPLPFRRFLPALSARASISPCREPPPLLSPAGAAAAEAGIWGQEAVPL